MFRIYFPFSGYRSDLLDVEKTGISSGVGTEFVRSSIIYSALTNCFVGVLVPAVSIASNILLLQSTDHCKQMPHILATIVKLDSRLFLFIISMEHSVDLIKWFSEGSIWWFKK